MYKKKKRGGQQPPLFFFFSILRTKKKIPGRVCPDEFWAERSELNSNHTALVLSLALCRTSLNIGAAACRWWTIKGSNLGPSGYEPVALTN